MIYTVGQSCLLRHLRLPTLLFTPIRSQAESLGSDEDYLRGSPREDPEVLWRINETKDGPVNYPMDGGDDGDDDDGDSSGDDFNDEDEDDDDEEEEDLAPADSAIIVHYVEPVPHLRNSSLLYHITLPPYISTTEARITHVRLRLPYPFHQRRAPFLGAWTHMTFITHHWCHQPYYHPLGVQSKSDIRITSTQALINAWRVNTRVTELAELLEHNTQGLATHQELQTHRDHVYAYETHLQAHQTQLQLQGTLIQTQHQVHKTRFQMQQAEIATLRETDRRRQAQIVETLRVMRDMRREMGDMQTELLALRG
ncbi:hypothetical protein Tco_1003503 [Tanacetum coccineum]|uniref:Uncharacterized protein n=1 Tax=Tanacetum coccineum TaxID=301880 RepID=A0ABQ5FAL3_9ASTR